MSLRDLSKIKLNNITQRADVRGKPKWKKPRMALATDSLSMVVFTKTRHKRSYKN